MNCSFKVHLEGGLIQSVYTNIDCARFVKVAIQDFDTDGADVDELVTLPDGAEFLGHIEPISLDTERSHEVFEAFEYSLTRNQSDYVNSKGSRCPNCGSESICTLTQESDANDIMVPVACNHCHSTWTDHYSLVGFKDYVPTALVVIASDSERGYWSDSEGWVPLVADATRYIKANLASLPLSRNNDAKAVDLNSADDFEAS